MSTYSFTMSISLSPCDGRSSSNQAKNMWHTLCPPNPWTRQQTEPGQSRAAEPQEFCSTKRGVGQKNISAQLWEKPKGGIRSTLPHVRFGARLVNPHTCRCPKLCHCCHLRLRLGGKAHNINTDLNASAKALDVHVFSLTSVQLL